MMQLNSIQHAVNEARVTWVPSRENAARERPRRREALKRLFIPGQVARFPSQESWEEFRSSIPEDVYEIIDHTDPLGFDGGVGAVIEPLSNPLNYLRRNQLPNKTIDMTNVYKPSVLGTVPRDAGRRKFIPFLGYRNGQYYPTPLDGIPPDMAVHPLPTETVTSVLQPRLFTYQELLEYWQPLTNDSNYVFFTHIREDTFNAGCFLFPPPTMSANVPQTEDCSAPTVGCFWFNDGRRGQLELPKDPACRACVIIRFKKYALV